MALQNELIYYNIEQSFILSCCPRCWLSCCQSGTAEPYCQEPLGTAGYHRLACKAPSSSVNSGSHHVPRCTSPWEGSTGQNKLTLLRILMKSFCCLEDYTHRLLPSKAWKTLGEGYLTQTKSAFWSRDTITTAKTTGPFPAEAAATLLS